MKLNITRGHLVCQSDEWGKVIYALPTNFSQAVSDAEEGLIDGWPPTDHC